MIEIFTSVIACECLFFCHREDDGPRSPRVDISVGLKLLDDALWDAFNNHGNGD